jgi:hypothetical protein
MAFEPFQLTEEDRRAIQAAIAEVDAQQAAVDRQLTPAQRVQKAFSMGRMVRHIAIHRLQLQQPELSKAEAQRLFLKHYYSGS